MTITSRIFRVSVAGAIAAGTVAAGFSQRHPAPPARLPSRERVGNATAKLPLSFEPNLGQAALGVGFVVHSRDGLVLLDGRGATVVVDEGPRSVGPPLDKKMLGRPRHQRVVRMELVGASGGSGTGLSKLPGTANYFLGKAPSSWKTAVPTYEKVSFAGAYSGIDLVFQGSQGHLEYDFHVAPGASESAIRLRFAGADRLRVDTAGDLVIDAGGKQLRQKAPRIFERDGARERPLEGGYRVEGNEVAFVVRGRDAQRELVIDPVLSYSTYLGGAPGATLGIDEGFGIAVDPSGNAYVTGYAHSASFPVTSGAFQTVYAFGDDVFVTKLNASGTALIYSTYLGGASTDDGAGIALDASGNAYVTGTTASGDFPTTSSAFQTVHSGTYDAFVTKLNASGTALIYSTYLGGASDDFGAGIALDTSGNAFVTGKTDSTTFPTTSGALQTSHPGFNDAFVTKLNASGTALIYSTYLGGASDDDVGTGIALDGSGNAFLTGRTASTNFPTTSGAFQTASASPGFNTAFVTKLNASGTALLYSTYLGGDSFGTGIALDASGNAHATGYTFSANFPTTSGAFQTANAGAPDLFVTKLNASGTALIYSTYLGGAAEDYGAGIALDASGNALVTGATFSANFPATSGALQTANAGSEDAFVARLNAGGTALLSSTYLGGTDIDVGTGIALDTSGNAYLTGYTQSLGFPTTSGAFQRSNAGASDAYVAKVSFAPPSLASISPTSGATAGGTSVTLTGSNFAAGATATFGGVAAANIVTASATQMTATTPAHAVGAVGVVVTNPDSQSSTLANGFTYVAPPSLASISPTSGPSAGGTSVTLAGSNLAAGATVGLGGVAATNVVRVSSTQLTATTPSHAAGAVGVVVTNPDSQASTLANGFTYVAPLSPPSLASISPTSGETAGGTSVTLAGSNFAAGATVTLGGVAATNVVTASATQLTAKTPAHAAGAVSVVVTNPDGQSSTLAVGFTFADSPVDTGAASGGCGCGTNAPQPAVAAALLILLQAQGRRRSSRPRRSGRPPQE